MFRALVLLIALYSSLGLAEGLPAMLKFKDRDETVLLRVRALDRGRLEVSAAGQRRVWTVGVERIYATHNRLFATSRANSSLRLRELQFFNRPSRQRYFGVQALSIATGILSLVPITLPILAYEHIDQAFALLNHLNAVASPLGVGALAASSGTCLTALLYPPKFRPEMVPLAADFEVVEVRENSVGEVDDIMFKIHDEGSTQSLNDALSFL